MSLVPDSQLNKWEEAASRLLAQLKEREARIAELEKAARDVTWFDWSDNDSDAVAAIDRLRKLVT